jgi:hypothetical protein
MPDLPGGTENGYEAVAAPENESIEVTVGLVPRRLAPVASPSIAHAAILKKPHRQNRTKTRRRIVGLINPSGSYTTRLKKNDFYERWEVTR